MNFELSTNFLLPYARKPAKFGGCGSIGLVATPTVPIHTGHPEQSHLPIGISSLKNLLCVKKPVKIKLFVP